MEGKNPQKPKMKKIFILNSDFAVPNTIGARALPILNEDNKSNQSIIFCRNYDKKYKNKFNLIKVVPFGEIIMKVLTAIPIYISKRFDTNNIKRKIFEYFLIQKLRKIDLSKTKLIHSWDFLPDTYKFVKSINPNINIIQDVAIALPNITDNIKNKKKIWKNENLITPNYIINSINYIDLFIAPSDFVKDSLLKEKIPIDKIRVFPFGVDVDKFKPIRNKGELFKVAFAGNINNRKGVYYLVKSWKELNLDKAELNLYGRIYPESLNYLKNNKRYNIKIHGLINTRKELPKNHIYVFPSLLEGSSKSVYEALACGLPVITTYNSGSIIRNNKEGFIIPIQNTSKIKEKILFFYKNRNELKKFGKIARKLAKKFTWENYATKVNKTYSNEN